MTRHRHLWDERAQALRLCGCHRLVQRRQVHMDRFQPHPQRLDALFG